MAWLSRLIRRPSAERRHRTVRLSDGAEIVLPGDFGNLTVDELAALGITPDTGEPSEVWLMRDRPVPSSE
jgi:hypothetical protein